MEYNLAGCERLANAIIASVAKDYRKALVSEHQAEIHYNEVKLKDARDKRRYCEKWFESPGFDRLSTFDGKVLAELIRKEVIKYDYDLKALYESHVSKEAQEQRRRDQIRRLNSIYGMMGTCYGK